MASSVVIVTGASKYASWSLHVDNADVTAYRGIGLAVATALLADSQRVVSYARSLTPELEALKAKHAEDFLVIQGDV